MMSNKKRKGILKKRAVIGLMFMNLFLIGAFCNLLVISDNGGKMPVYTNNNFTTSPRHFIFNDSSQVKEFILSDIMHAEFRKQGFEVYFSIGDVIIYATGISFVIYCFVILVLDVRYLLVEFQKSRRRNASNKASNGNEQSTHFVSYFSMARNRNN